MARDHTARRWFGNQTDKDGMFKEKGGSTFSIILSSMFVMRLLAVCIVPLILKDIVGLEQLICTYLFRYGYGAIYS
jgi:hypothetical protein